MLCNEFLLFGSEIGSLHLDDEGQQLVFETLFSDGEVDECALSLDFWWVVGVGQLRVEEEIKLGVKSQFFVSHLNNTGATALDNLTTVDWSD